MWTLLCLKNKCLFINCYFLIFAMTADMEARLDHAGKAKQT